MREKRIVKRGVEIVENVWRRKKKKKKKKKKLKRMVGKREMEKEKNNIKNKKSKLKNVTVIFSQYFYNKF